MLIMRKSRNSEWKVGKNRSPQILRCGVTSPLYWAAREWAGKILHGGYGNILMELMSHRFIFSCSGMVPKQACKVAEASAAAAAAGCLAYAVFRADCTSDHVRYVDFIS